MNRSRKTGDLVSQNNLFVDITNDRIGIGSTVPGNKLSLPDSAKIGLGNAEDLTLHHDGTHSYITNTTGDLRIVDTTGMLLRSNSLDLRNGAGDENYITCAANGTVKLYYNNSEKLATTSVGINVTGTVTCDGSTHDGDVTFTGATSGRDIVWDKSADELKVKDNTKISFGTDRDLQLSHNNSDSVISHIAGATGNLKILSGGAQSIECVKAGAVNIAHNGSTKLATTSSGISVTGSVIASSTVKVGDSVEFIAGDGNDLRLWHNSTDSYIKNYTGDLWIQGDGDDIHMRAADDINIYTQTSDKAIVCVGDGAVEMYHNNSKKIETTSSGAALDSQGATTTLQIISDTESSIDFNDHGGSAKRYKIGTNISDNSGQFEIKDMTANVERLRIDTSGRILKGLTTARGNFANNTSGVEYGVQIEGTSAIAAGISIIRNSNDANDGGIVLGKTRATSNGGNTVVQAGDDLGNITFAGSDGTTLQFGAEIFAEVQSGVGNDDLPTDLIFKTNGGSTSTAERLRITSAGHLLFGNRINDRNAWLQFEGTDHYAIGLHRNTADHGAPAMRFSASRGTTAGSNTIVQNNDYLGMIRFEGTDGSDLATGAYITSQVDGTPGSNDMPARLGFWTSADGSQSPTERLRIKSGGQVQLPVNGQELTWGASQQFRMYWENSEDRMYLQGAGAYGLAFRVNNGNRLEINKTTGDVTMQGASGRNFNWDNSDASLYLTDSGSGSSARLKVGSGGDLQLYHDVSGMNHITCATNQELKISANKLRVFDYTGVTEYFTVQSDKVMVHKDLKASTNNSLDIGANGAKFRRAFATHFVHRTGSSSGVGVNESEAIYVGGGLHFFHDYVTLSTSNFTHGLTSNRSYDLIRLRNSGSGSAIYAENGSISSGSDYRMKENVSPITGAIDMVKKLKPCTYNIKKSFNEHDAGGTHHGFIAHEVQEAIPNIVNIVQGTKDAMEEVRYMEEDENIPSGKKPGDGTGVFTDKPDMQGIDYGHMTPILCAALKEAIAEIETLKAEVASLKSS